MRLHSKHAAISDLYQIFFHFYIVIR